MGVCLFANNATSTLAGSISAIATVCNIAPGSGALFPSPTGGDYFVLTFTDAATGLVNEIVHVTSRTGDALTITRAQEGTSAAAWNAGDLASALITAGALSAMVQDATLLIAAGVYVEDTSGAANTVEVTLPSSVTSLAQINGTPIRIKIANTNTGTVDIAPVGLASSTVTNPDGSALVGGQLVAGGVATFIYVADNDLYYLQSITKETPPARNRVTILSGAGTYNIPNYVQNWTVYLTAGGGGAAGGDGTYAGGGGGAGGTVIAIMNASNPASRALTYSVGGGGVGGAASGGGETGGGNSTLTASGYSFTANGGTAGTHSATPAGGAGGGGSGSGSQIIYGGAGTDGALGGVSYGGNGGASYWGGGGRASTTSSAAVQDGLAPGSGGGGGYGGSSVTGGDGGNGCLIIEWGA